MKIAVEPTKLADIEAVIDRLPQSSKDELRKSYPTLTIYEVLNTSVLWAKEVNTLFIDGKPVAIMGVTVKTALSNIAHPWLIPTVDILKYKKTLLPASKRWIGDLLSRYPVLENVGTKSDTNKRWLEWLGFRVVNLENGYQVYRLERKQ